jgi:hypothetical protein
MYIWTFQLTWEKYKKKAHKQIWAYLDKYLLRYCYIYEVSLDTQQ